MPFLTCLIATAVLGQQTATPEELRNFKDLAIGVQFDYPKSWRYKKERLYSKLEFPLASGKRAEVQILGSDFRQSTQQWQDIQVEINASVRRLVEKQWQETILGMPLLLTKLNFKEPDSKGVEEDKSTLVGLLYSKTAKKFTFRLTSPAGSFDEAETTWRKVLNTLRPTGELPDEEDGSTDPRPYEGIGTDGKTHVLAPEEPGSKQNLKGLRKTMVTAIGTEMELWMPKSWEVGPIDGGFALTSKGLKGKATFEAIPGGIGEAQSGVLKLMEASMPRFTVIKLRKEYEVKGSKAGCMIVRSERHGLEGDLPLVTLYAAGVRNGNHWLLSYEVKSVDDWKDDEGKLNQLLDGLVLQAPAAPAP